jgi:hypothetical protein
MISEIIQSVVYDSYDNFGHVNFIFLQNFISLFWGLFNDETDLRTILDMSTSYFCKTSFHYFEGYLMMKLTLG